jgi:hypothetical protein
VDAAIGDLAAPRRQVGLELRPAAEASAGDRVLLHIADAALVLPLAAGAVGRTGARPEAPVSGEGVQLRVEPDLARRRVMVLDERPGVVEQDLGGNAAEVQEGALDAFEPVGLSLPQRRSNVDPSRVAERGDEQVGAQLRVTDPHPGLAEVDRQLMPRRRLEPHRRACLGLQLASPAGDPTLDMAQAQHDPVFGGELLADDVGVAAMPEEPLAQPIIQPVQRRPARRPPERRRPALTKVSPHRVPGAPELARQPLGPPAEPVQPNHRRHLIRLQHLLSLRRRTTQGKMSGNHPLHQTLLDHTEGSVLRVDRGSAFQVARQPRPARPVR